MKRSTITLLVSLLAVAIYFGARYFYFKPKFINGEAAPSFTGQTLSGEAFDLSSLRGSYVLLDFWGSWCGPCRAQSPGLVALYQDYHGKDFREAQGFEIVSIGIERDEQSWKQAIAQDGLDWPYHLLDQANSLRFFDSGIAGAYGVKQVPTKYLLNPEGVIVGVDLSFEDIRKILDRAK